MEKRIIAYESKDLVVLAYFLLYALEDKPHMMYGGYTGDEAWESLCRMFFPTYEPEALKAELMGDDR